MKKIIVFLAAIIIAISIQVQAQASDLVNAFASSYAHEKDGKYADAADDIKKSYIDSYECNVRLGWLLYADKKYESAVTYYQKAVLTKPSSLEAYSGLGNALAAQEKWTEANKVYVKMIAVDPNNTTANYRLALGYYYAKNYELADKHNSIVLKLYPFDYYSNLLEGGIKLAQGKLKEAKAFYHVALLVSPTDTTAKQMVEKL